MNDEVRTDEPTVPSAGSGATILLGDRAQPPKGITIQGGELPASDGAYRELPVGARTPLTIKLRRADHRLWIFVPLLVGWTILGIMSFFPNPSPRDLSSSTYVVVGAFFALLSVVLWLGTLVRIRAANGTLTVDQWSVTAFPTAIMFRMTKELRVESVERISIDTTGSLRAPPQRGDTSRRATYRAFFYHLDAQLIGGGKERLVWELQNESDARYIKSALDTYLGTPAE